jgi:hypothetical protein
VCEVAQPKYHILKSYANGVMDQTGKFYPYKTIAFIASGTLAAKNNVRYFLNTIEMNNQGLLSTGPLVDKVEATSQRSTTIIAQLTTPVVIAAVSSLTQGARFEPDILTDLYTVVTVTIAASSPIVIIRYAEIDEEQGDYQG